MSSPRKMRPLNLAVRFFLELAALTVYGFWGWYLTGSGFRYVLAGFFPLLAALIWGTFNVPGDPSRSGNAPVVVLGLFRLLIELCFFGVAALALWDLAGSGWALGLAVPVLIHYVVAYRRVLWLLEN